MLGSVYYATVFGTAVPSHSLRVGVRTPRVLELLDTAFPSLLNVESSV